MSAGACGTQRRAEDAEGLRGAWRAVEGSWRQATDRASALPDGAVDVSAEGEWCFSQTLRHLVFATGAWLSRGIQGVEETRVSLTAEVPLDQCGYHPAHLRRGRQL